MRSSQRGAWFLLVVLGASSPLAAQVEAWRAPGAARSDAHGGSVAAVDDADGDGRADLLIGAPGTPLGRVELRSSASGTLLREWTASVEGDGFGLELADLGDVDGDGARDFGVTAPTHPTTGFTLGALFVYSGTDGTLIRATRNDSPAFADCGTDVAGIGDVDGDGCSDYLTSNVGFDWTPSNETVSVVSGRTGANVRSHFGSTPWTVVGLGLALDGAGDVDGDGIGDYVVGAPFEVALPQENGAAYLYSGASGQLVHTLVDPTHPPRYGIAVRMAGDVDGDGLADVLVAAPDATTATGSPGIVNVHSGATGAILATASSNPGDQLGWALSPTGDFDGDLLPDFVATARQAPRIRLHSGASGALLASFDVDPTGPGAVDATRDLDGDGVADLLAGFRGGDPVLQDPGAGRAVVVDLASGATGVETTGVAFEARCGESIAVVRDRDGDGHRELAIGWPGGFDSNAGRVRIVSGASGQLLAEITNGIESDRFGAALASLGDVEGDGLDDLAIGAPGHGGTGVVEVRSGADDALLATIAAPSGASSFGTRLAAAIAADGTTFLAISDPGFAPAGAQLGRVEIHDLKQGTSLPIDGAAADTRFGEAIACAGDVDGDGRFDWAIGAPAHDAGGQDTGRIFIVSGSDGSTLWTIDGSAARAELGTGVAAIDDLDGDGAGEVLAGAPHPWTGRRGRVTVCSGRTGAVLATIDGQSKNDLFGSALARIGDVNGDGAADFVAAAPRGRYVELRSGATTALLYRFLDLDGFLPGDHVLAAAPLGRDTRVDSDDVSDLAIGQPRLGEQGDEGLAMLRRLAPLLLQVKPARPPVNFPAVIESRGGPSGGACALFIVGFDGAPMSALLAVGSFGADGIWTLVSLVPPSLSGHSVSLQSFATGFSGSVVVSQVTLVSVP